MFESRNTYLVVRKEDRAGFAMEWKQPGTYFALQVIST
jgi:hypothetical protein